MNEAHTNLAGILLLGCCRSAESTPTLSLRIQNYQPFSRNLLSDVGRKEISQRLAET